MPCIPQATFEFFSSSILHLFISPETGPIVHTRYFLLHFVCTIAVCVLVLCGYHTAGDVTEDTNLYVCVREARLGMCVLALHTAMRLQLCPSSLVSLPLSFSSDETEILPIYEEASGRDGAMCQ